MYMTQDAVLIGQGKHSGLGPEGIKLPWLAGYGMKRSLPLGSFASDNEGVLRPLKPTETIRGQGCEEQKEGSFCPWSPQHYEVLKERLDRKNEVMTIIANQLGHKKCRILDLENPMCVHHTMKRVHDTWLPSGRWVVPSSQGRTPMMHQACSRKPFQPRV